jgi:uracil-DNA glycosylase family 4
MANIVEDIKNALEFYRALGFERLPIKLRSRSRSAIRGKSSGMKSNRAQALHLMGNRTAQEKEEALKALRAEIGDCRRCKLSGKRTTIVFGEGNPDARIMFIGEAPGREEDLKARPFVGDAGMLLTKLIEKMGFKREDVYIANIIKCRPPMNRDPEIDEIEKCRGFVEKQIEIINPDVIMSLGRISTFTLIEDTTKKITAIRGKLFDYRGIHLVPTFHPAYLIRNPKDKWLTWSDAQKALELLGNKDRPS